MDHIGFGLSSCSGSDKDYHPRAHARHLHGLMDKLGLENITLFLIDWGGPIGLDFASRRRERVKRLIIANTWPVSGDPHFVRFSSIMSSRIGRFLIRRLNIFVNMVLPKAVGDRSIMTKAIMHHYRRAQTSPFECSANPSTLSDLPARGQALFRRLTRVSRACLNPRFPYGNGVLQAFHPHISSTSGLVRLSSLSPRSEGLSGRRRKDSSVRPQRPLFCC